MVRAAAGNNIYLVYILYILCCERNIVKYDFTVLDTGAYRVAQSLWLLLHFLHHKMLIAALFSRAYIPVNGEPFLLNLFTVHIVNLDAVLFQNNNLVIFKVINLTRVLQNRRNVRSNKIFIFAKADNHRACLSYGYKLIGIIRAENA